MDAGQVNVVPGAGRAAGAGAGDMGMTIRGLAGLYAVMGQNFAPGTTAADIESAMTPVGGDMVSCRIIKTSPFLIAEMVFSSREGGERVIETFNNKIADGRLIKLYPKVGGYKPQIPLPEQNDPPPTAPRAPKSTNTGPATRDQVIDGSLGFPDLTNADAPKGFGKTSTLYSDKMAGGNNNSNSNNRSGSGGFQRGRGSAR
ncbi:hypothetical protein E4U41_000485 [Claviceps citrina]|nr:hypothetical protein E4U41_000485 [Claviceps citrina]